MHFSNIIIFVLIVAIALAVRRWIARIGVGVVGLFLILVPAAYPFSGRIDFWGFGCAALGVVILCADVVYQTRRSCKYR